VDYTGAVVHVVLLLGLLLLLSPVHTTRVHGSCSLLVKTGHEHE